MATGQVGVQFMKYTYVIPDIYKVFTAVHCKYICGVLRFETNVPGAWGSLRPFIMQFFFMFKNEPFLPLLCVTSFLNFFIRV